MIPDTIKLSVIISVHDQAEALEQNLPLFLSSQGEVNYEVIVVDDSSSDETPDVLKRFKNEYPRLYTTFLPHSEFPSPSRRRLALTIGAKAAHSEWIAIVDINRPPVNESWVDFLYNNINKQSEVVSVYRNKKNSIQSWDSLEEASPFICKAERRSGHGHQGNLLTYQRGAYDSIVVRKDRIYDALKLFDKEISSSQLCGLSIKIFLTNIFN